jgi:hypothetical protein
MKLRTQKDGCLQKMLSETHFVCQEAEGDEVLLTYVILPSGCYRQVCFSYNLSFCGRGIVV